MKITWSKEHLRLEALLLAATITLMAGSGFLGGVIPKFANVVDTAMGCLSLLTALYLIRRGVTLKKEQAFSLVLVLLFFLSVVLSVVLNGGLNGPVQAFLYVAYFLPLLLFQRISDKTAFAFLLPLIIVIGVLQLPADWLFPREGLIINDAYAGTFSIANNKSRFLFMLLLVMPFLYGLRGVLVRPALLAGMATMAVSLWLGDSVFVYVFGILAITLGGFHRNKRLAVVLGGLALLAIGYLFTMFESEPLVYFTVHRFFDAEHGVWAVVLYVWQVLQETHFLGAGLGEFVSRASQSLGGHYLASVPRTMITFGEIFDNTAAPYGLPAYLSLIAETGVIGLFISALLLRFLYVNSHASYIGFALFLYLLLITMYMPMFFEGADGMIYLYSYMVLNKALAHVGAARSSVRLSPVNSLG